MPGPLISLSEVRIAARFAGRLASFLRQPINLEEARAAVRRRLEQREADFLATARRAIYGHTESPYRQLLSLVGCEYGDFERLVIREGVEGALRVLYRHGVYLTVDEFKGRQLVVRGSTTIAVDPSRLRNPWSAFDMPVRSSGSRGVETLVKVDLAFVRGRSVNTYLVLDARGGTEWRHAVWGLPGRSAMVQLLEFAGCGAHPVRWFSQVDADAPGLALGWTGRAMRWGSFLAGVRLPRLLYVPLSNPLPIASWMAEVLRDGNTPHLLTFASSAVRLCQAALDAEIDLRGAQFTLTGEPLTAARLAVIRGTGAEAMPRYGSSEAGTIGHGCLAPEAPDDVHLLHDRLALIQPGRERQAQGFRANALFVSSLRPTAPFVLLNVSLGDQASVLQRACGCPLARLGWSTHLHTIRSYEKLTCGGMTFLDTDVVRVLEEVLPARFGGVPTDYQLVEDETDDGHPRLRLLVHPAVGPLDTDAVAKAFLMAIETGPRAQRVQGLLWREGAFLRVERLAPQATPSGKILHLHLVRRPATRLVG